MSDTSSSTRAQPAVSVVVCAYTERRWTLLAEAVASVRRQSPAAGEIVLVVDHNPQLEARARAAFAEVRIVPNERAPGLAGARNTGVLHSRGDIIAFLDDDAAAAPGWLAALVEPFGRLDVMGAGGIAEPVWDGPAPDWLPPEFLWVVGASYVGLPEAPAPVRNPIGANMAFRREAFDIAGGFTDGIGRVGRTPLGCEETEFSIRLRRFAPDALIMHVPAARVEHHVPAERATWGYFFSRCWAEGISKALVTAHVGGAAGLSSERAHLARTLPLGVLAGLRAATRGEWDGLARAAAIVLGTAVTAAGFARGRAARSSTGRSPRAAGRLRGARPRLSRSRRT